MGDIGHDMAADLQMFLKVRDQKWLIVTTPRWVYWTPTNSPMLNIEWEKGWYFFIKTTVVTLPKIDELYAV